MNTLPRWLKILVVPTLVVLIAVPIIVVARLRATTSPEPRVHLIMDMADQPKLKTQRTSPLFTDGRAMRPPVADTLARGDWPVDEHLVSGKVRGQWATTFPSQAPVTMARLQRGREQFDIYCAPCHGLDGTGGIVTLRAQALGEAAWVKPPLLDEERVLKQPPGQIFDTISNGRATMPAYVAQILVEDRWAIVAYVQALQRSRHATPADVPPEKIKELEQPTPTPLTTPGP